MGQQVRSVLSVVDSMQYVFFLCLRLDGARDETPETPACYTNTVQPYVAPSKSYVIKGNGTTPPSYTIIREKSK